MAESGRPWPNGDLLVDDSIPIVINNVDDLSRYVTYFQKHVDLKLLVPHLLTHKILTNQERFQLMCENLSPEDRTLKLITEYLPSKGTDILQLFKTALEETLKEDGSHGHQTLLENFFGASCTYGSAADEEHQTTADVISEESEEFSLLLVNFRKYLETGSENAVMQRLKDVAQYLCHLTHKKHNRFLLGANVRNKLNSADLNFSKLLSCLELSNPPLISHCDVSLLYKIVDFIYKLDESSETIITPLKKLLDKYEHSTGIAVTKEVPQIPAGNTRINAKVVNAHRSGLELKNSVFTSCLASLEFYFRGAGPGSVVFYWDVREEYTQQLIDSFENVCNNKVELHRLKITKVEVQLKQKPYQINLEMEIIDPVLLEATHNQDMIADSIAPDQEKFTLFLIKIDRLVGTYAKLFLSTLRKECSTLNAHFESNSFKEMVDTLISEDKLHCHDISYIQQFLISLLKWDNSQCYEHKKLIMDLLKEAEDYEPVSHISTEFNYLETQPSTMRIYAKTLAGGTLDLDVNPSDTIEMVKLNIQSKYGFPADQQRLAFAGLLLDDKHTISEYNVQEGSALLLLLKHKGGGNITVYTLTGDIIVLYMGFDSTIARIKQKIQDQEGISADQYQLKFDGKQLEANYRLCDYGFHSSSRLLLVMYFQVILLNERTITLNVTRLDSVKKVKKEVENEMGIFNDQLTIFYKEKQLHDDYLMTYHSGSVLEIKFEHKYIHLDSCGKLIVLCIEPSDTLKIVKESIQEKIKIPCDQQQIIFEGEILQDDYIISNYNIQYSKLKVVLTIIDSMQILVETQAGLTLALDVSPGDTIKEVKQKIQEKEGISFDQQQLNFDGYQLNDECTLSDCNIQEKSVIYLIPRPTNILQMGLKKLTGEMLTLDVKFSDTIGIVKQKILQKEGIPPDEQHLIFNGKEFKDECTLSDCNFQEKSYIFLVQKNKGSMQLFVKIQAESTLTLEVKPNDTIESIKQKIQEKKGIPPDQQHLVLKEEQLMNECTLSDYSIKSESFISLIIKPKDDMKIFVKMLNGKKLALIVNPSDTIGVVKQKLQAYYEIPLNQQCLIFDEKQLIDKCSLSDYGIKEGSVISLQFINYIYH